jgi:hypothetical protein
MSDYSMYAEVFLNKIKQLDKFEISEKYPPIFYTQQPPKSKEEE